MNHVLSEVKHKRIWIAALMFLACSASVCLFKKSDTPEIIAGKFLHHLCRGEALQACSYLGSQGCAANPPGGWSAYLSYPSGLEPNIAFLLGSSFDVLSRVDSNEFVDPLHKDVIHKQIKLKLEFPNGAQPFLLPVELVSGTSMELAQLDEYSNAPDREGLQGLTLRVRRNLPKDPGKVIKADGSALSTAELQDRLPRLQHVSILLDLVHNTGGNSWKVWKCTAEEPTLTVPGGRTVALTRSAQAPM